MNQMHLGFMLQQSPSLSTFQQLFDLYLALGAAVAAVVIGWFLYHIIRARERAHMPLGHHSEAKPETWRAALTMVLITASILATVEIGTFLSAGLVTAPNDPNAIHITVTAYRFGFNFTYPNGTTTLLSRDGLIVPAGRTIILNITSVDVFHTFGISDLPNPVKADALPGLYTTAWFSVSQAGTYTIRCYELCGSGHFGMFGKLHVVTPGMYASLHYGG